MHKKVKWLISYILLFWVMVLWTGCGNGNKQQEEHSAENRLENRNTDISSQLFYENSMELMYAEEFAVDYYQDGYALLTVSNGDRFLVVPKDMETPEDLAEDIVVLEQPLDNIYLVASAVMDIFRELDALDSIRFSGQKADGWCIEEAREEMEKGNILYAGKYSMPDYELILSEGCSLAIENNMIFHSPEVIEKLESFGIPVFIDYASYEKHPLGRVEWVKLYGLLMDEEETAQAAFDKQARMMEQIVEEEVSGKTVAFFYITTNGMVNVRNSNDYVPKMIELAGGKYVFADLGDADSKRSSTTMQMEEFYHTAWDADYLIYNSTSGGEIVSIEELVQMDEILKNFKAVQEGNVWCTTRDMYQQSMSAGGMIEDIHHMLSENIQEQEEMMYMYQLK